MQFLYFTLEYIFRLVTNFHKENANNYIKKI